ncbi:MAG: cupredoxin domain-containing protein [Kiloniellales bacterium]
MIANRFARQMAVILAVAAFPALTSPAFAEGTHSGAHRHDAGKAGKAANTSRTLEIILYDNYYEPETIDVVAGETVRFIVRNQGELVHEFNIATPSMHRAHQEEMQMMVDHGVLEASSINTEAAKAMQASMGHGMHDEPNSVLLEPGQTGEVIWTFPVPGNLEFACNVPGHYDAGMVGEFSIN